MGLIRNPARVNDGIELFIKRVGDMYVKHYREVAWAVFVEVLRQTPQYTGRAVANWKLTVGSPDYDFDPDLGDKIVSIAGDQGIDSAYYRGHPKWIEYAMNANLFKVAQIKRDSKVYITNGVQGDDDRGRANPLYLEALQDPSYWGVKLRAVNQPYETAQETIIKMAQRIGESHGFEFNAGGANFAEYT